MQNILEYLLFILFRFSRKNLQNMITFFKNSKHTGFIMNELHGKSHIRSIRFDLIFSGSVSYYL